MLVVRRAKLSSLNLCTGRPPVGVMIPETVYHIYSRNSRSFLTKILYLNLGCVIYARKRFYVNKSGYTGNFLNIVLKA